MCAHQLLTSAYGFLALSDKQQAGTRLSNARFHALIRRILSAALKRNFHTRGIDSLWHCSSDGKEAALSQLPSGHIERKHLIRSLPLKGKGST